ncbi:hypothetical protein MMC30_007642 [Trapelia coarctata]|nr:hypothetical protein [Trapelia coarctata]
MGFLLTAIFRQVSKDKRVSLGSDARKVLSSWDSRLIEMYSERNIPPGPYILFPSAIYEVLRLYPDPKCVFMYGVIQSDEGPGCYERLESSLIPVPSRLYFNKPTASLPLNGKRVAVKDIFDMRGVETSAGCRAYEMFHGKSPSTASCIPNLIDLGAVIVGKTKTTQFASGEYPKDWVDYQCPFSSRGDGYFDASCSSTGSAAGIAAYEWLDFAIGTDTLGSMTEPAAAHGIYGVRPTHGALALDGVLPRSLILDTPGYFSRDIEDLGSFGQAWYGENYWTYQSQPPKSILVPQELFTVFPESKRAVMMDFIDDLNEAFKNSQKDFDVETLWDQHAPATCCRPVVDFLDKTLAHIYLYDSCRSDEKFRKAYSNVYEHDPYVDPMVRFKWDYASFVSKEDYDNACKGMAIFKRFIRKHVFNENNIMILPGGEKEVVYRDQYLGRPEDYGKWLQGFEFHHKVYSCLGGLPQIVVPVGQHLICSTVTSKMIYEPISVIVVGPAGSDGYLIDIIKKVFKLSGRPLSVQTGANAFPPPDLEH